MSKIKPGAKTQHISWVQHLGVYLNSHFLAFTISFRNLSLTPLASFMTMAAIGVCLSLPVGLYLFFKNIQQISGGFDQGSAISLYIDAKSTTQQIDALILKVKQYPFVEKATYLSPEKALSEFQETSGLKDALSLLPENPLPGVISIEIDSKKTTQAELIAMKESLAKLPLVKQAAFDYEWVEKLNGFISFGKILINCLYLIIGLGVVLMVGNTIRLALERHKDEIEVLNLIGATVAFIRRPFLYRGALYGGLGGVIAILMINTMSYTLEGPASELSSLFHGVFFLENLSFYDTVLLLIASACLGWLGAAIAFAQQHRTQVLVSSS